MCGLLLREPQARVLTPLGSQVTYGSFDYTSLLYLSDYLDDFGGGRFVFMEEGANKTVEPRAGRAHCRFWGGGCIHGGPCVSATQHSLGSRHWPETPRGPLVRG